MALLIDVTNTPVGVGFASAYARVSAISIHRGIGGAGHRAVVDVAIYATIPDDNTQNVDFRRYVVPAAELVGDVIPAAYAWLKQQPDFAMAGDV